VSRGRLTQYISVSQHSDGKYFFLSKDFNDIKMSLRIFDNRPLWTSVAALSGSYACYILYKNHAHNKQGAEVPPHRPSWIPFLGKALELGSMPIREFLLKCSRNGQDAMFSCAIAGDTCVSLPTPSWSPLFTRIDPNWILVIWVKYI